MIIKTRPDHHHHHHSSTKNLKNFNSPLTTLKRRFKGKPKNQNPPKEKQPNTYSSLPHATHLECTPSTLKPPSCNLAEPILLYYSLKHPNPSPATKAAEIGRLTKCVCKQQQQQQHTHNTAHPNFAILRLCNLQFQHRRHRVVDPCKIGRQSAVLSDTKFVGTRGVGTLWMGWAGQTRT